MVRFRAGLLRSVSILSKTNCGGKSTKVVNPPYTSPLHSPEPRSGVFVAVSTVDRPLVRVQHFRALQYVASLVVLDEPQ